MHKRLINLPPLPDTWEYDRPNSVSLHLADQILYKSNIEPNDVLQSVEGGIIIRFDLSYYEFSFVECSNEGEICYCLMNRRSNKHSVEEFTNIDSLVVRIEKDYEEKCG